MPGPEIEAVIEMLRANPPVQGDDVVAMRAGMGAATAEMPLPEDVEFEPVDAGGVRAEWMRAPGLSDDRAVVYLPCRAQDHRVRVPGVGISAHLAEIDGAGGLEVNMYGHQRTRRAPGSTTRQAVLA